jgi:hypothetical protein
MRPHQRQFIICPTPWKVSPDWQVVTVKGVGYLSHCPLLPVQRVLAKDECEYILIGIAVQTDPSRPSPLKELQNPLERVEDLTQSWAGRWALIANGTLMTDTISSLGCYYSFQRGHTEVSSSVALLRSAETAIFDDRKLELGVGVEWYVAPLTRFVGIRRLLASQQLELNTGEISPKRLFRTVELTNEQALEQVEQSLVTATANVAKTSSSVWLPLTAGFDSRLLLAAAFRAGIKVQCYTFWYRDMTHADLTLPPNLAARAGCKHALIRPGKCEDWKERVFAAHTSDGWADHDGDFLCRGQWEHFGSHDIILRGAGMEVGCPRARFHFSAPEGDPWRVPPAGQILAERGQTPTPALVQAFEEWRAWTEATPHPEMDWRDRFYVEQRLGTWASSNEQAVDLAPGHRVFLSNSGTYMSSVLQMPESIRCGSTHQVELIRRMAPSLLDYPFNPRDPLPRRIPKSIRRRVRSVWRAFA